MLNDKDRLLHSDIATVLYGAGVIGLFLFIRMYYLFFIKYIRLRNQLKKITQDEYLKKLYAIFLSIIICLITNTLTDGMTVCYQPCIAIYDDGRHFRFIIQQVV